MKETVPLNLPCVVSYFRRYAAVSGGFGSLIATISTLLLSSLARNTILPIRPKPLMATRSMGEELGIRRPGVRRRVHYTKEVKSEKCGVIFIHAEKGVQN